MKNFTIQIVRYDFVSSEIGHFLDLTWLGETQVC